MISFITNDKTMETINKKQKKMQVEVWSDIMCPFCYIGKRHYEKAITQFSHSDLVEIVWKSFQLDPTTPVQFEKKMTVGEYLAERKGVSVDQANAMNERVTQMASEAGLTYNLDKAIIANSFKAHRVIQMAKTKGLGDAIEERLFKAYFTDGLDFGDEATLYDIGEEVGLSKVEVKEALTNDDYAYRVKQDIQEAHQIGVSGVPFFVFNKQYAVSGAQPVKSFSQTLEESFQEWKEHNPNEQIDIIETAACKPGEDCN